MRTSVKYRVIRRFKDKYNVRDMCVFFGVSRSGYYAWIKKSDKEDSDKLIGELIQKCQEKTRKTYTYLTKHKHIDGTMYSCTSFGTKIGGGIGVALCGWLLDASGFVKEATVQPASCMNMLHIMYLWIPMILSLIITFIISRMNVEAANQKLREQMEEC